MKGERKSSWKRNDDKLEIQKEIQRAETGKYINKSYLKEEIF